MNKILLLLITLVFGGVMATLAVASGDSPLLSPSPEGARVYFIEPQDGAQVPATFTVKFGLTGMGVAPAGAPIENTGHHHLLIDRPDNLDFDQPLPATEQVKHFGGGQTETTLTLSPGKHCLQLLMGNYVHVPHRPQVMSEVICVIVTDK